MFSRVEKKQRGELPKLLKFVFERSPGLLWAIAFRPMDEQFDAYVGWAVNGKSPFLALVQIASESILDEFDREALMLPTITIARRDGASFWSFWNPSADAVDNPVRFAEEFARYYTRSFTESEAEELVREKIAEAMTEVELHCIPYLEEIARRFESDRIKGN